LAFKALFIAHAPDADKDAHRCTIETGKYRLFVVVVRDQEEAVQVAAEFAETEQIDSILLCPGFTHADVAEIAESLGGRVAVAAARTDGPGSRIALEARRREGYPGAPGSPAT
jgi:hypothetical protein